MTDSSELINQFAEALDKARATVRQNASAIAALEKASESFQLFITALEGLQKDWDFDAPIFRNHLSYSKWSFARTLDPKSVGFWARDYVNNKKDFCAKYHQGNNRLGDLKDIVWAACPICSNKAVAVLHDEGSSARNITQVYLLCMHCEVANPVGESKYTVKG